MTSEALLRDRRRKVLLGVGCGLMEGSGGGIIPEMGDGLSLPGSALSLTEVGKVFSFEFRHGIGDGGLYEENIYGLVMRIKLYFSSHNSLFANVVLQCDMYGTDARKVTRCAKHLRQLTCNHRNLLHLDEHVTPAFLPQEEALCYHSSSLHTYRLVWIVFWIQWLCCYIYLLPHATSLLSQPFLVGHLARPKGCLALTIPTSVRSN